MKKLVIFILILSSVFITSCTGVSNDVDKMAIGIGYGLDLVENNMIKFTVQILMPEKVSSGTGGMKKGKGETSSRGVMIVSVVGNSFFECLDKITNKIGKPAYFGQIKFTVIGKSLAERGVAEEVDFMLRFYTSRPQTPFFITNGNAEDVIKAVTVSEPVPAIIISELYDNNRVKGFIPNVSRMDFANLLASDTASPIAPVINVTKSDDDSVFQMGGTAIFKKDKLIGFMNIKQTRGLEWIMGNVKNGSILGKSPDKGKISFDVLKSTSKIKPLIKDNKIVMEVNIKEQGNMMNLTGKLDPMEKPQLMQQFDEIQNEVIKNEAQQAVYMAQKEFKVDIFNFGEMLHREYPEQWNKIKDNWEDIFPSIDVVINVNSQTKRTGLIGKPIH